MRKPHFSCWHALILTVSFLFSIQTVASATPERKLGPVKAKLREYISQTVDAEPTSGSVLIAQGGKILLKQGYGMANYFSFDRRPNNPKTVFHIASMTQAFTAVAVMMLQERGLLDVADNVADYVPEIPNGRKMTIQDLLIMESGLSEYLHHPLIPATRNLFHAPRDLLRYFVHRPVRFQPGERFEFCHSNYVTLGIIIERVSGMTYGNFLKENIFEPLRMKHTSFDPSQSNFFQRRAIGYDRIDTNPPMMAPKFHTSLLFASNGIYSNVKDILKWARSIYTDRLVSHESWETMLTQGRTEYGYGWNVDKVKIHGKNHHQISQIGGIPGFHGFVSRLVDEDITIIGLLNTTGRVPEGDGDVRGYVARVVGKIGEIILPE